MTFLRLVRTVLGGLLIALLVIPFATLIGLAGLSPRADAFLRTWCRCVLVIAGVRVTARFRAPLDPAKSYVFVSNHTSHLDAPSIITTSPIPLRFIAKRELRRLPLFGWAAVRMGHTFVDRKDSHGAARAIQRRVERGLAGIGLLFFAEGTRATTPELLPFKKGAAITALQTSLDCVPIGIAGAAAALPPGWSLFRSGPIAVVFGAPIPAAAYTLETRDELVAAQRAAVESCVAEAKQLLGQTR